MTGTNTFYKSIQEEEINQPRLPYFQIEPLLPYASHSPEITDHVRKMEKLVKKCIPENFLLNDLSTLQNDLLSELPLLVWQTPENAPGCIQLTLLCLASKEDYLEEKIESIFKAWLIPEKTAAILSMQSLCFQWNLFPDRSFLVMEISGLVENGKDLNKSLSYIPSLTEQLSSGIKDPIALRDFFSQRPILIDLKQSQIHHQLVFLLKRLPHVFNAGLFTEMGHFFSLCHRSFFESRDTKLITKILALHFLIKLSLTRNHSLHPERRHLEARLIRTVLTFPFGSKPVLALILGVSPLNRHEFLEETHITQAAESLIPGTSVVKGSFYSYQAQQDPICTLYAELEKKDGSPFSLQEISLLKQELKTELKRRIEKLVPSVFMPRNEEETMRNILLLSQELKNLSDCPQLMISLDTQTTSEVFFTVVLVRISKGDRISLAKAFEILKPEVTFIPDRVQQVGFLKKNSPKEAHIFHLRIPKDPSLLRTDNSVNFYLARKKIISILNRAIGHFRDYNGGMILKQGELFYQFQDAFLESSKQHPELLETFFFSLTPIDAQATLPLSVLGILFHQFLEAQEAELLTKGGYHLIIEEKERQLFITIKTQGNSFKEEFSNFLAKNGLCSKSVIQTSVRIQGILYTGIIFPKTDERKKQNFIELIHQAIKSWAVKSQNQQILKLNFLELPQSFDPRLSGDEYSNTITKMLFEGLTRLGGNGKPQLAIAQEVQISPDKKKYLFKLKKTYWSNGSLLRAYDFEYAWKKILSPDFTTPFAYVFYPIKNAKAAKENRCPIEEVAIKALDDLTLSIELEYPTPEFLELTALSTYSPINHVTDKIHPNWGIRGSKDFLCNGPFLVNDVSSHSRYEFTKNPFYWDKDHVRLQKLLLSKNSSLAATEMFKNDETHWLGRPLHPWEFSQIDEEDSFYNAPPIGVYWCGFNTEKFPFHNTNLRRAFDLAINRGDLTSKVPDDHLPAATPLPLSHTMNHDPDKIFGDEEKALELFELALKELNLTRESFPLITLNFNSVTSHLRASTASYLVRRWKKLFGIPCRAEGFDFNTIFSKILKGDFQIVGIYWKSNIDNPNHILNVFRYNNLDINFTKWFNAEYQELLDMEQRELDPVKKIKYLSEAEKILIKEAPVFSIFYGQNKNKKKEYLKRVLYSKTTGQIDFAHAYIERQENY